MAVDISYSIALLYMKKYCMDIMRVMLLTICYYEYHLDSLPGLIVSGAGLYATNLFVQGGTVIHRG